MPIRRAEPTHSFKIGDRVVVDTIDHIDGNDLYGCSGTVVSICSNSIGVMFDNPIPDGHDCGGHGRNGHCWYCLYNVLSLIVDDSNDEGFEFEESQELQNFLQEFKRN